MTNNLRLSALPLHSALRLYWPLIKSLPGLLLSTGIAGYFSSRPPFNIDAKMERTHMRPAASGQLQPNEILVVGRTVSALGSGLGVFLAPLYGLVVFAGWFFDVIVYTVWLKRQR